MRLTSQSVVLLIVALHHAVAALHGAAHAVLQIALTPFQIAFIAGVIVVAPALALVLLFTRLTRPGALLLTASMLGALIFGLVYHVVLPGPDNLINAGEGGWAIVFQTTGPALSVFEGLGALTGTRYWSRQPVSTIMK
jgi:hypothetical protein